MSVSKYLREWEEDRAKYLRFALKESIDGAALSAIDISAATAKVRLRAWKAPASSRVASAYLLNTEFTKVGDGTAGKVHGYFTLTTSSTLPGQVQFEVVLVDEAVGSQPTPTTYRERVMLSWNADVVNAVQPTPSP